MTWKLPQIEQYRERHALGTTARLAPELMLNVAARREDAYKLGRQHLSFDVDHRVWKLTWRPSKTLRSTGKTLTIPILPDLQAALYALPRSDALSCLTTDYGRPFASAAGFGEKFSEWCNVAGLQPVICDDGKTRNFRAHGLRKAAIYTLSKAGGNVAELQALGGRARIAELQKYIQEIEQQTFSGMANVAAMQAKARTPQWLTPGEGWLTEDRRCGKRKRKFHECQGWQARKVRPFAISSIAVTYGCPPPARRRRKAARCRPRRPSPGSRQSARRDPCQGKAVGAPIDLRQRSRRCRRRSALPSSTVAQARFLRRADLVWAARARLGPCLPIRTGGGVICSAASIASRALALGPPRRESIPSTRPCICASLFPWLRRRGGHEQ